MTGFVDPIVVEEARKRLARAEDDMRAGAHAAEALLWFAEYGNAGPKEKTRDHVLDVQVRLVASSTPKAASAEPFVKAAGKEFEQQILARAIEMAQAQFDKGTAHLKAAK